jgi:hypothetical protein
MPTSLPDAGVVGPVDTDETVRLISADKVEGTDVFNRSGERIGSIATVMINKRTGQVAFVALAFGGIFGFGETYHPLPWKALIYDVRLGGYVIDVDTDRLADAPSYGEGSDAFADPAFGRRIEDYWAT